MMLPRLTLVIVALVFVSLISIGNAQPKLGFDKKKIDLGTIYNGTTKKARIVIRNSGRDTLKVLGVSTSCGCTTVKQPKGSLLAGQTDTVEVEFNSTGFRGKIEKHISFQTNEPQNSFVGVTLVCDVVEELQPVNNASVVWLGSVPKGKQVEQVVAFKNVSGKVITLMGFKSSSPDVSVTFTQRTVLPADTIRMNIKATPRKTDYISELVMLVTDSNKQSQVPIRVTLIGVTPN